MKRLTLAGILFNASYNFTMELGKRTPEAFASIAGEGALFLFSEMDANIGYGVVGEARSL
jgi:hypothetical protein